MLFQPQATRPARPSPPPRSCAAPHPAQFDRVAAAIKALGRPFPRALDLASARNDLGAHLLREVPGLRLVTLLFSPGAPATPRVLGPKRGRQTPAPRRAGDAAWDDGLGRFDAVIAYGLPALPAMPTPPDRRPAVELLSVRLRELLLPGGAFLLSLPTHPDDRGPLPASSPDDLARWLDDAGWHVDALRAAPGHALLKART